MSFILQRQCLGGCLDRICIEYVSISDPETLAEVDFVNDRAVYAVAVRIGTTRLVDNAVLGGVT